MSFQLLQCAYCYSTFARNYRISEKRKSNPQYCSRDCLVASFSRPKQPARERFWPRVDVRGKDECWPWKARTDENGYGCFDNGGRPIPAHRFAFFDKNPHSDRKMNVCHSCDNPPCCNPRHLWLGTQLENVADMDAKGRRRIGPTRRGHDCNKTKLSEEIVKGIMTSAEDNKTLALRLNVTPSAIYNVRHGKAWSHVTGIKP